MELIYLPGEFTKKFSVFLLGMTVFMVGALVAVEPDVYFSLTPGWGLLALWCAVLAFCSVAAWVKQHNSRADEIDEETYDRLRHYCRSRPVARQTLDDWLSRGQRSYIRWSDVKMLRQLLLESEKDSARGEVLGSHAKPQDAIQRTG